jgi:hypothetical protein
MNLKGATVFAIIALFMQLVGQMFYLLANLRVIEYSTGLVLPLSILFVVSSGFLLLFFIVLYSKQLK